jgi:hypothetical protein
MKKTIQEAARETPVRYDVDVIVAGGGPAGIGAALGAARNGAKTLLVEEMNCLGGIATSGMMSHWCGGTVSPVTTEIMNRSNAEKWDNEIENPNWVINQERLKLTLFDLMEEAGVTVLLHTRCADVVKDGDNVTGVILESKSGREAVRAKVVIDATGDGDVAARAGAEYAKGREDDQKMQPVTLMFKIGGVDWDHAVFPGSFESKVETPKGELQALAKKLLPPPAGHVLLYKGTISGQVVVNMTNLTGIDGTSNVDLTHAEIVCHRQIPKIIAFLREYVPGYEKCYHLASAAVVGVRETRHFKGLYTLNEHDIVEARVFDDWIATKNRFNFDIHNVEGAGLDKHGAQHHFTCKGSYSIPYSACVPEKLDGLLLSGRNISGTHKAHSNFRVMPICTNIGFGVGIAAAEAVRQNCSVRRVDIKKVQAALEAAGVTL